MESSLLKSGAFGEKRNVIREKGEKCPDLVPGHLRGVIRRQWNEPSPSQFLLPRRASPQGHGRLPGRVTHRVHTRVRESGLRVVRADSLPSRVVFCRIAWHGETPSHLLPQTSCVICGSTCCWMLRNITLTPRLVNWTLLSSRSSQPRLGLERRRRLKQAKRRRGRAWLDQPTTRFSKILKRQRRYRGGFVFHERRSQARQSSACCLFCSCFTDSQALRPEPRRIAGSSTTCKIWTHQPPRASTHTVSDSAR